MHPNNIWDVISTNRCPHSNGQLQSACTIIPSTFLLSWWSCNHILQCNHIYHVWCLAYCVLCCIVHLNLLSLQLLYQFLACSGTRATAIPPKHITQHIPIIYSSACQLLAEYIFVNTLCTVSVNSALYMLWSTRGSCFVALLWHGALLLLTNCSRPHWWCHTL